MIGPRVVVSLLIAAALGACSCAFADCKSDIRYDGLGDLPGSGPAVPFGAMLLPTTESRARVVAIRPDGRELFFTLLAAPGPQIMRSSFREGRWQPPERASFSDAGFNTEPSLSPDARTLYFVSTRPPSRGTDIWKVERAGERWSDPVRLGEAVNGDGFEWHPQVTANGDLYFAAADRPGGRGDADLYVARFRHGAYLRAENLGAPINTAAAEWDPYVSAAGDYLIFKSTREGGQGGRDLYFSRRAGKSWSPPRNLGPVINTADDEDAAEVTPDGRYLTFARSKPGAEAWKMYWLELRAVLPELAVRDCIGRAQMVGE